MKSLASSRSFLKANRGLRAAAVPHAHVCPASIAQLARGKGKPRVLLRGRVCGGEAVQRSEGRSPQGFEVNGEGR